MADKTIKPCPFCGSDAVRAMLPTCTADSPYHPADRAFPVIVCQLCLARVPGDNWDHTGMTAVDAWNRRAEPTPVSPYIRDTLAKGLRTEAEALAEFERATEGK